MGRVIIGIHGLSNKVSEELLKEWWEMSIYEGLYAKYPDDNHKIRFEMVYWADLFYKEPLDPAITNKKNHLYVDEAYIPSPKTFAPIESPIRRKIYDIIDNNIDDILLNDNLTTNYSYITDKIFNTYFEDLGRYYANKELRNTVRERFAEIIRKHKRHEIMLLTHSMGTIIAYEVLTHLVPDIKINTFVTMGSPLGFPLIKVRIGTELNMKTKSELILKTPENVTKHWYNFSDINDKVALDYTLSDDYIANSNNVAVNDFLVHNDYISNNVRNPHKSFGYLRTPEFAGVLWTFIEETRNPLIERIINTFNKARYLFSKSKKN